MTSTQTTAAGGGAATLASRTTPIVVRVVEDFPLVRDAIATCLAEDPRFQVLDVCPDGAAALKCAAERRVDVNLLDLHLPDMGGMVVLDQLKAIDPTARVVLLTACERPEQLLAAMAAGASGYLTKRQPMAEIAAAIVAVHAGGTVVGPSMAGHLVGARGSSGSSGGHAGAATLNDDEVTVLRRIAEGATDAQIAREMFVSTRTVQNLLSRVRAKTGVSRRAELTRWAMEHAWI